MSIKKLPLSNSTCLESKTDEALFEFGLSIRKGDRVNGRGVEEGFVTIVRPETIGGIDVVFIEVATGRRTEKGADVARSFFYKMPKVQAC